MTIYGRSYARWFAQCVQCTFERSIGNEKIKILNAKMIKENKNWISCKRKRKRKRIDFYDFSLKKFMLLYLSNNKLCRKRSSSRVVVVVVTNRRWYRCISRFILLVSFGVLLLILQLHFLSVFGFLAELNRNITYSTIKHVVFFYRPNAKWCLHL